MTDDSATAEALEAEQGASTGELGLWVFLATEVLFFSALFVAYAVNRYLHPAAFLSAGREANVTCGTINSVILLASSLTILLAVKAGRLGAAPLARRLVLATVALGLAFLVVKGIEYAGDFRDHLVPDVDFRLKDPDTQIFWCFYWIVTVVHAVHLTIGLGILLFVFVGVGRRTIDPRRSPALEIASLYWHFVDVVWLFLYPTLYLVGRS